MGARDGKPSDNDWVLRNLWNREPVPPPPDPDLPKNEEGAPMPIVYGRTRVRRAPVLWWGDLKSEKKKAGDDDATVIGYTQKVGIQFGVSLGMPNIDLTKVWIGDYQIWGGSANTWDALSSGGFQLPDANLIIDAKVFGGTHKGGVAEGHLRWYPGNFTQTEDDYLDLHASTISAYRGVAHVTFMADIGGGPGPYEGFKFGYHAKIPPIQFEVESYPDALAGASYRNIDGDANPIEVIYDLLTREYGGLGLSSSLIDTTTLTAMAQTIHGEVKSGVSMVIDSEVSVADVIEEISKHIDAVFYEDPTTHKITGKLIREDYTKAALPHYTETEVREVLAFDRAMYPEQVNRILVEFEARQNGYQKQQGIAYNSASFEDQAKTKPQKVTLPYVRNTTGARIVSARYLRWMSTAAIVAKLAMNRTVFTLRPGDVFRWSDTALGISDIVMRVRNVDLGSSSKGDIVVECELDNFASEFVVFEGPPLGAAVPVPDATAVTDHDTVEAPGWVVRKSLIAGSAGEQDSSYLMLLAGAPDLDTLSFSPEVSSDAGANYFPGLNKLGVAHIPFAETAKVQTAYSRTAEPYDTSTFLRIKGVSNPDFGTATADQIRVDGANMILIVDVTTGEHEWMSYESFDELALNAAAEVWIYDDSTTSFVDETTDFNSSTDADWSPVPATSAAGDYLAIGLADKYTTVRFDNANGTAGVGGAGTWQYLSASGVWRDLTGVTDATTGFTAAVADNKKVTFTYPGDDWTKMQVNGGASLYFIRFLVTTGYSTRPVYDQGLVGGIYRFKNVWRGLLDTAPISLGVNSQIYYAAGNGKGVGSQFVESTGRRGDEALKVRHVTTTGRLDRDTSGDTAEDITMVRRAMLPYPPADIQARQEPAVIGDTGMAKEYPGSPVAGSSDNWIVEPELVTSFVRRLRTPPDISRGDDADEDPDETSTDLGIKLGWGTVVYRHDLDADGLGYVNIGSLSTSDGTKLGLTTVPFSTGDPDEALKIYARRNALSSKSSLSSSKDSFTAPKIKMRVAEYREQLVDRGFDDNGRGWTTVSGSPVFTSGTGSLNGTGRHFRSSSGTSVIEKVFLVQDLAGKDAAVRWYLRDFNPGGTASCRLEVTSEDASTVYDTFDTGFITGGNGSWAFSTFTINNINASADRIRVKASVILSAGSGKDGGIDEISVRICNNAIKSGPTNGQLNSALTSWGTTTNIQHQTSSPNEGAGYAEWDGVGTTCTLAQDSFTLPSGYTQGDVVRLSCRVKVGNGNDQIQITLEAHDGSHTVLETAQTAQLTFADTDWHNVELYMIIPASAVHVHVQADGSNLTGAAKFDDFNYDWYDLS